MRIAYMFVSYIFFGNRKRSALSFKKKRYRFLYDFTEIFTLFTTISFDISLSWNYE
jgi:hypothetical protein